MKTIYMILSGIILSVIGTILMAGLLSLSSLVSPGKNNNIKDPLSVKVSRQICDNSQRNNDKELSTPDAVRYSANTVNIK